MSNVQIATRKVLLYTEQESKLLLRKSRSYLFIYCIKRKSAFDACLFWCIKSGRVWCDSL